MIDDPALRSTKILLALVAFTAVVLTSAACSTNSGSEATDPPVADGTTTTTVPMGGSDPVDPAADPTPADDPGVGGGTDGASSESDPPADFGLPGDFPAIPLPDYDRVDVIGTGQMGSGKYSGRAVFVMEAFMDKPLDEMIAAYGEVLVNAGFSPLELDDEGARIRGWSTAGDGELEVDITAYKDRPGELEIGGAHWDAIGL